MGLHNETEIVIRAKDIASSTISRLEGQINSLDGTVKRASQSLASMGLAPRKAIKEISRLETATRSLQTRIARLKPKMISAFRGIVGIIGGVRRAVFSLTSAFIVLGGTLLVKSLINTAESFETLRTQLDALQGSSEAGRVAVEWVKQFARDTPLSMEEVTRAFVRAKALGLDPMDGTLQSLVDVNAKLAGSGEKLLAITRAVGEMFTKSSIQAQEMTLQLTNAGVPAWDLLAKAMNRANGVTTFTVGTLRKMSEEGKLGRKEVKLLIDEMGRFGAGAALARMSDFAGLASNFGDEVSKIKDGFARAENGLFDFSKALLGEGITSLEKFRKNGSLEEWGRDVAFSLLNAADSSILFARVIADLTGVLATLATPITRTIGFFTLLAKITKDSIDGMIAAVKRLNRTFKGELGEAFDTEPIDIFETSLDKASDAIERMRGKIAGATQKRLAEDILGQAQIPFQKNPDILPPVQTPAIGGLSFEEINKLRVLSEQNTLQEIQNSSNEFNALADAVDISHKQGQLDRQAEFNTQFNQLQEDGSKFRQGIARRELEDFKRTEALKLQGASSTISGLQSLASNAEGFSKKRSKAMFLIGKGLAASQAFVATLSAATQALAVPPAPNFALAGATKAIGFANVAAIIASSLSGGSGGFGGGGGGGSIPSQGVNSPGSPFQDQSSQINRTQSIEANITIVTPDAKSFLDNAREVRREFASMLADTVGNNGGDGEFSFVVERN